MLFDSLSLSKKEKSMMHLFPCVITHMRLCALICWKSLLSSSVCMHSHCGVFVSVDVCVCLLLILLVCVCLCVWWRAEPTRQTTTKRRKRKNSASSASNSSLGNSAGGKKRSPANNFTLASQVPVSIQSSYLHTHTHIVIFQKRQCYFAQIAFLRYDYNYAVKTHIKCRL